MTEEEKRLKIKEAYDEAIKELDEAEKEILGDKK
jgi:hypothetical protein